MHGAATGDSPGKRGVLSNAKAEALAVARSTRHATIADPSIPAPLLEFVEKERREFEFMKHNLRASRKADDRSALARRRKWVEDLHSLVANPTMGRAYGLLRRAGLSEMQIREFVRRALWSDLPFPRFVRLRSKARIACDQIAHDARRLAKSLAAACEGEAHDFIPNACFNLPKLLEQTPPYNEWCEVKPRNRSEFADCDFSVPPERRPITRALMETLALVAESEDGAPALDHAIAAAICSRKTGTPRRPRKREGERNQLEGAQYLRAFVSHLAAIRIPVDRAEVRSAACIVANIVLWQRSEEFIELRTEQVTRAWKQVMATARPHS